MALSVMAEPLADAQGHWAVLSCSQGIWLRVVQAAGEQRWLRDCVGGLLL